MLIPVRTGTAAIARNDPVQWARRIPLEVWVVAALTVLGASLRFATIASQSYWFDEAQAAQELHLSFGAMLSSFGVHETNPPLYFVLGWGWARLFGTGEAGLRSLSAVAGTAVIPLAYLCGRELVSRRAGVVAAALAAVNPFMIWYSQEAREYMLLAALCAASFWLFARAWRQPSTPNLASWALLSALALLTHYFAGFLVAAEAVGLLYKGRNRASAIAVGAVAAVEAVLVPHAFSASSNSLVKFITAVPLSIRIRQVPVTFGLGTLYQSSLVTYGLLAFAVLAGCLIVLLVVGASSEELRGAGLAAAVAGAVVLMPLAIAVLGRDVYIARALIPAWVPLAVVVGGACTAPRARAPGAALAIVLLGAFVYASFRINDNPQYQRPNWRGVAAALGTSLRPRAIVAYDGSFAAGPLSFYLRGALWRQSDRTPVTIGELDVVGSAWQTSADPSPAGTSLISTTRVDGYLVERYSLASLWHLTPGAIGARAATLLRPAPPAPAVLTQRAG